MQQHRHLETNLVSVCDVIVVHVVFDQRLKNTGHSSGQQTERKMAELGFHDPKFDPDDDDSDQKSAISYQDDQKSVINYQDDQKSAISYKERRREAHTQAEQKRRDAIKRGYEDLQTLVPTCQQQDSISSYKLSKAIILQRSIDYIQFLLQQKRKQEDELNALRKEVVALQIMKANYETIVKVHQSQPGQNSSKVSDEMKFQVFQAICDTLFQSFNSSISVANFGELSACVFSWLEEYCKPQTLQEMMLSLLCQINHNVR